MRGSDLGAVVVGFEGAGDEWQQLLLAASNAEPDHASAGPSSIRNNQLASIIDSEDGRCDAVAAGVSPDSASAPTQPTDGMNNR